MSKNATKNILNRYRKIGLKNNIICFLQTDLTQSKGINTLARHSNIQTHTHTYKYTMLLNVGMISHLESVNQIYQLFLSRVLLLTFIYSYT